LQGKQRGWEWRDGKNGKEERRADEGQDKGGMGMGRQAKGRRRRSPTCLERGCDSHQLQLRSLLKGGGQEHLLLTWRGEVVAIVYR